MADLNALIAQGAQFAAPPDPFAQYGKMQQLRVGENQNALAQYQLESAKRTDLQQNALNRAYSDAVDPATGQIDYSKVSKSLAAGGAGGQIPAVLKLQLEGKELQSKADKAESDLLDAKLKQARGFLDTIDPTSPDAAEKYIAWHKANHSDPIIGKALAARGITADNSFAQIDKALKTPGGLAKLIQQSMLGTEKFMEMNKPTTQVVDQSGQRQVLQIPGLGGTPVSVGTYADVPLPKDVVAQKKEIARAGASNLNVNTEKTYGSKFGGLIADADAAKLSAAENAPRMAENADRILDLLATGKVITGTGASARLQLAKALNLAGGTDSEQIKNTEVLVSSLAETTLGAIKASNLGAGQGFTNTDREFLEKAVAGQLSYDQKSLGELARLSRRAAERSAEAWNKRAVNIPKSALEGTGYSTNPVVIPVRQQKAGDASPAPTGVDQALWNAMTPQERKLWQK